MKKPLLAEIAKQRQVASLKQYQKEESTVVANLPQRGKEDKGKVRDQIAKEAGKSGRTVSSVEQVLKSGTEDLKRSARVGDISIFCF